MADPIFGISIRKIEEEGRPVLGADLSTIGLIGPSSDADAETFPLDTPVLLNSDSITQLADLGEDGYLSDAIRGINDQLGETQFAARVVIVRTAAGVDADPDVALQETITNIMGSSTSGTGVWAFMKAPDLLGFVPRIIIAPGYTGQMENTIETVVQESGQEGSGYTPGQSYTLTFSGGGDGAVQATAHAIGQADGSLGPAIIDTYGGFYTTAPTVEAPDPSPGTAAVYTATIGSDNANPVCAALTPVLNQLMAHAIVESAGTSQQDDIDWRETMSSQRLIPISGGVKILDPVTSTTVVRPFAPRVAGIAVRRDHEKGAPFHSWANQPVQGIIGPSRSITFSLTDDANEAQELLRNGIGCLTRGEAGNDFAIAQGGFVFVGTDTASEDPLWAMYNVSRGRDYIHLGLLRAMRYYLGRFNIVAHTVQAIMNTMGFFLRDLKADGHILGYQTTFSRDSNSPENIRLGKLTVGFKAEEPPVLKHLTIESACYREAISAMVADLAAQLNRAI